jgi:hypothetical protein
MKMSRRGVPTVDKRDGYIHIETDNGIINVWYGLTDRFGRSVDRVSMIPDRYAGENKVVVTRDGRFVRLKGVKA